MSNPKILDKEPAPQRLSGVNDLSFDASVLRNQHEIPPQFVWPEGERPGMSPEAPELGVPVIDLAAFLSEDSTSVSRETSLVSEACKKHGFFFFVVNHGINPSLLARAQELMDVFFGMELSEKQRAQRKIGDHCGYASSFTGRFSSKLPWKETLSFRYSANDSRPWKTVEEYFLSVMGEEFRHLG